MDLKKFKLELINQIMRTDDLELLQTIQQVLQLNNSPLAASKPSNSNPLEPPFQMGKTDLDEAAQELQDSIDDVFNP